MIGKHENSSKNWKTYETDMKNYKTQAKIGIMSPGSSTQLKIIGKLENSSNNQKILEHDWKHLKIQANN